MNKKFFSIIISCGSEKRVMLKLHKIPFSRAAFFYLCKQSNWKSLVKLKTLSRERFFVYDNKWPNTTTKQLNQPKKLFLLVRSKTF